MESNDEDAVRDLLLLISKFENQEEEKKIFSYQFVEFVVI